MFGNAVIGKELLEEPVCGFADLTLYARQTTADACYRFHLVFRRSRDLDSSYV